MLSSPCVTTEQKEKAWWSLFQLLFTKRVEFINPFQTKTMFAGVKSSFILRMWVIDLERGQDGWIVVEFFILRVHWLAELRSINKKNKNDASIEPSWPNNLVNKGFTVWLSGNFPCWTQQVVPSGQDSTILPARLANHSAKFCSSLPFIELAIQCLTAMPCKVYVALSFEVGLHAVCFYAICFIYVLVISQFVHNSSQSPTASGSSPWYKPLECDGYVGSYPRKPYQWHSAGLCYDSRRDRQTFLWLRPNSEDRWAAKIQSVQY